MNPNDTIPNTVEDAPEGDISMQVSMAVHAQVVQERNQYQADIVFTAEMIARLLLDIGLFNADMELQPIHRVLRKLPGMLINQNSLIKQFSYLGDLGGIIEKYHNIKSKAAPALPQ